MRCTRPATSSSWPADRAASPGSSRGRAAFLDEDDRAADNDEVRVVDGVPLARRALVDGRVFDVVKVFWHPEELAARLRELDWDVDIRRVAPGILAGVGVDTRP